MKRNVLRIRSIGRHIRRRGIVLGGGRTSATINMTVRRGTRSEFLNAYLWLRIVTMKMQRKGW